MKKYSQGEGELEVLRGEEAVVVNEHLSKTGKSLQDFSDAERKAFHADLDAARGNTQERPEEANEAAEESSTNSKSDSAKESE